MLYSQQWYNTYNGQANSDDRGYGIVADSYGNIYTAGYTTNLTSGIDIIVLKHSNSGQFLWKAEYSGPGNQTDKPNSIVIDNSGIIYVTGYTTLSGGNIDFITLKINLNGAQQWAKTFNGTGNQEDKAWGIVADNSGNCFVTGTSKSSSSGTDIVTIKYNTNGNAIWTKSYDAPAHKDDEGRKIAIDGGNNIYVAGFGEYSSGNFDFLLLKYNSGGSQQWVKNYNGNSGGTDKAWGLVVDADDYIHITGESQGNNQKTDIATLRYNSSGTLKWTHRFNGIENLDDRPYGIVVDEITESVIITGTTGTNNRGLDIAALRINKTTGELNWSKYFNGEGNNDDIPYDIVMAHSETNPHFLIAGTTKSGALQQDQDICVVSYSVNGNLLKSSVYNGNADQEDGAFGIAIDQNDNYFLAGYTGVITDNSSMAVSYDIITTKYDRISFVGIITPLVNVPENFYLSQNYPNPFNPETVISFGIPENSNVNISVYDVNGRLVNNPVNTYLTKGSYNLSFSGSQLSSGIYFYRINAGRYAETKTMILVK